MKQITTTLLLTVIFTFFVTQTAFAAGNTNISSTGLNDIVHADDADNGKKDDGEKKGEKKEGEGEPDCE